MTSAELIIASVAPPPSLDLHEIRVRERKGEEPDTESLPHTRTGVCEEPDTCR